MSLCLVDLDCESNELCYTNTSYFESLQVTDNNRLLGCDCNSWFGWSGSLCNDYTLETFIFSAIAYILAIINFVSGAVSYSVLKGNRRKIKSLKEADSRFSSSLFTVLGCFGIFIWTFMLCLSHFVTTGPFIGDSFPYNARLNLFLFYGASLGTSFLGAAAINVCFIWLEIANQAASASTSKISQLRKYRWVLYLLFFIGVISITTIRGSRSSGNHGPNVIGLIYSPIFVAVIIVFRYTGKKLEKLLAHYYESERVQTKGPSEQAVASQISHHGLTHYTSRQLNPQLEQAILNIQSTYKLAIVALGSFCVSFFLYSSLDVAGFVRYGGLGWRNSVNPGSNFPLAKVACYIGITGLTIMNANLARYIYREQTAAAQFEA